MHFAGDTGLFFLAHALQVCRQFTQLLLGPRKRQLRALALGNVPDNTVPDHPAVGQAAGTGLDVGPPLLTFTGEDSPLPGPVLIAGNGQVLHLVVVSTILRVDQIAQAHLRVLDLRGRITHQRLTALADVGELRVPFRWCGFQTEHQPRHIASNTLEPRLAFTQRRQGAVAFGDIGKVHHQVLGIAKAQEAQRQLNSQQTAVGAQALGFELPSPGLPGSRGPPQLQPAVHAQVRLEVAQRTLQQRRLGITQHAPHRVVGVTHVAVPVDPEDAHRTLVDGELAQAQCLLAHLPLSQVLPRRQQATLELALLAALPHQGGPGTQQQHAEQQRKVLPETGGVAQTRVFGLQPTLMQLLQLFGGHGLQAPFKHIGQQRPVTPRTHAQ
ncbi:hypothetical protein D3C78_480820 [compost metagenome]